MKTFTLQVLRTQRTDGNASRLGFRKNELIKLDKKTGNVTSYPISSKVADLLVEYGLHEFSEVQSHMRLVDSKIKK